MSLKAYQEAKAKLKESEAWFSKLGQRYAGGGGGIGKIAQATFRDVQIYHQESNRAMNYWDLPDSLRAFLNDVAREYAPELLAKAIDRQRDHVKKLAAYATQELREALVDAGLEGDLD